MVTEPFSEWVLSGDFPAGRPAWEAAGARFVADVHPHEQRKLLLLNGGHSLARVRRERARARDHRRGGGRPGLPRAGWTQWWDEAVRHVPLPAAELAAYRAALLARFANPRIRHTLAQIAADGSQKIPIRVLPVLRGRAGGRAGMPPGAVRVLAAWIAHLRGAGAPVNDAGAGAVPGAGRPRPRAVLELLAPDLAGDDALIAELDEGRLERASDRSGDSPFNIWGVSCSRRPAGGRARPAPAAKPSRSR